MRAPARYDTGVARHQVPNIALHSQSSGVQVPGVFKLLGVRVRVRFSGLHVHSKYVALPRVLFSVDKVQRWVPERRHQSI